MGSPKASNLIYRSCAGGCISTDGGLSEGDCPESSWPFNRRFNSNDQFDLSIPELMRDSKPFSV